MANTQRQRAQGNAKRQLDLDLMETADMSTNHTDEYDDYEDLVEPDRLDWDDYDDPLPEFYFRDAYGRVSVPSSWDEV